MSPIRHEFELEVTLIQSALLSSITSGYREWECNGCGGYNTRDCILTKYTKHGRTQGGRKQEVNPKRVKRKEKPKNKTERNQAGNWGEILREVLLSLLTPLSSSSN